MLGTVYYFLMRILPVWVCLLVLCLPFVVFSIRKNSGKTNWFYWVTQYVFLSYLIFVLTIGGVTRVLFYLQNPEYFKLSTITVNWIPFINFFLDPSQYLANIILFLPFGFLFPLLASKNNLRSILLWGMAFSFSIELLQAFCLRTPDINDLLMNTLGAVLGYLLFTLFHRKIALLHASVQIEHKQTMSVYFLLSYLFIFLYDFLSSIIFPIVNS